MIVIRDRKSVFMIGLKDVDGSLKHEIKFIIKRNESLAENKIRKNMEQLVSTYMHGNNIHEHRKQQNEWTT